MWLQSWKKLERFSMIYPSRSTVDEEEEEEGSVADFLRSRLTSTLTSSSLLLASDWRLCFMRRFWNQTLTWRSVRSSEAAISMRRGRQRYLLKWNSFSSSKSWVLVYAVRRRRGRPSFTWLENTLLAAWQSLAIFIYSIAFNVMWLLLQYHLLYSSVKLFILGWLPSPDAFPTVS